MSKMELLLKHYINGVQFPKISGFEVLELLDVRSKIAQRETELNEIQKARLEEADSVFMRHAVEFYESVSKLGDLRAMRQRANVPCSHWWWYLEKLAQPRLTARGLLRSGLIGLWKDRKDIRDSSLYARKLREQAQSRSLSRGKG